MADGVIPSENAWRDISETVKHFKQTYRNRGLRHTTKRVLGSRGKGCKARNEIWQLVIHGSPTGGSLDLGVNVLGTTETVTLDWDMTNTEVQTEFEGHSQVGSGNVECTGGPFPDAAVIVEFKGDLAKHAFPLPTLDFSGLTGGSGVGVVPVCYHGHPKDGSVAP